MAEPILILGASGRAAAFSALRAGLTPMVIDLFADEDLRAVAEVRPIPAREYPRGFVKRARQLPPMPWMYTGGLENHPDLVAQIAAERPLWGNGPAVLAKVRDPFALAAALDEAGLPHPRVQRGDDPPVDGLWLDKPLHGSGGVGIRPARRRGANGRRFFQEFVEGESRSAIFRDGEWLGVTRQLVGQDLLHAPRFGYCGSVGPIELDDRESGAWKKLGAWLVQWSGIRGVFGVDAIVRDGVPWLIEVNPRYTASVEVIEYATASSFAKAVYYAARTVTIPHNGPWQNWLGPRNVNVAPEFADIPRAGSTIRRGRPVLTMFGKDENELRTKAQLLDSLFGMRERP